MKKSITVIINADIHTMKGRQRAKALACDSKGGMILDVGGNSQVLGKYKAQGPEVIDLKGKVVLPGFTDCHTHFCNYSLLASRPDLDGIRSIKECLQVVARYVSGKPPGQWILGGGWNKNIWTDDRLPSAQDLDTVSINNPVMLWSKDWHTIWLNSSAMVALDIHSQTPDVSGGAIERDAKGRPSGLLREEAANHYYRLAPKASEEEYSKAVILGQKMFAKMGLTGFHTMEGVEEFNVLQFLSRQNKLFLRGTLYHNIKALDGLISAGIKSGFGDKNLKIGGVKLFADGSLGSQTALMLEPYRNSATLGMNTVPPGELLALVSKASKNGLACAIHAIGDAGNRLALDTFQKAKSFGKSLRHRIEHCQLVHPDDIARFNELNIIASVQPIHCPSDLDLIERYWGARGAYAYPFGDLSKSKARMVFGSDCPIEKPNPFWAIQAAVTRQRIPADRPSFHPEQRVSLWNAIKAYTVDAAYASGDEAWKGTLEPGKAADFICLSEDIFKVKPEEIHKIKVERTFIGGREI
ncbi:MAG: amidohydrolase [Candidatus Edwardsbacteria bacterium]|nr:amidohydrolase [Candidatus Edwardsbacteria bacterium]MBU1577681.1 amidohydrolase [Candidatus Edwardsbacteria bacterium]MBU2463347.1 amidohydrolase [Candidatus Edwardsbacteria bacterium]MBU2594578.1 amidohydrolase [Candidatus Edwardsbacteria bacterium]